MVVKKDLVFPEVTQFDFFIKRNQIDRSTHTEGIDLHCHKEFEIYINLSGDISFLVNNRLYPLTYGDVVISRPGEYHHCIYRSSKPHSFFWLLCNCETSPFIYEYFMRHSPSNFISPNENDKERLIQICEELTTEGLSEGRVFFLFTRLLSLFEESDRKNSLKRYSMSDELTEILNYIDTHVCEKLTLDLLEQELFISKSTIERRFQEELHLNPSEFIRKRKLVIAANKLRNGISVLEAGNSVGYADNSHFIKLFKEHFGVTPNKYKKETTKQ